MPPPPGPAAWTAGQVARYLGISESTLRTWHRRYGLSPHDAEPGRYRRYQADDVARLQHMVDLINGGMLASEAARAAQDRGLDAGRPDLADSSSADSSSVGSSWAETARDEIIAAAQELDTGRCTSLLDALFDRRGVVEAWELVCCPVLWAVDAEPRDDPEAIAVEHALTWALLGALHRRRRPPAAPGAALALLACTDDDQHTLPLAALAAALGERGHATRVLGARTPALSVERAVAEARPGAVVLWAQVAGNARPGTLRALARYPVDRIAAGPGWDARDLAGARLVTSLRGALAALGAGES